MVPISSLQRSRPSGEDERQACTGSRVPQCSLERRRLSRKRRGGGTGETREGGNAEARKGGTREGGERAEARRRNAGTRKRAKAVRGKAANARRRERANAR